MSGERILGVLAGKDAPRQTLSAWARTADWIAAADSGADLLAEVGIVPDLLVGDLDSVTSQTRQLVLEVTPDDDPNRSDCDKLLAAIQERGHAGAVLAGLEGDRLDHLLASLFSCLKSRLKLAFLLRDGIGVLLRKGEFVYRTHPGVRVSFLPLVECANVHLKGVRWPLAGDNLSPGGIYSLSNIADSQEISISMDGGAGIVVLGVESKVDPWTMLEGYRP